MRILHWLLTCLSLFESVSAAWPIDIFESLLDGGPILE